MTVWEHWVCFNFRACNRYQRDDFFDNIALVLVSKLDDITGGVIELDFFDNGAVIWVLDIDNITGGIGELDFFDNIAFV